MSDEKLCAFDLRIAQGDLIEADDWMPDEFRRQCLRLIVMHANSELMAALAQRDWIPRAPGLLRKVGLLSRVQDELGHSQLLYRIAEDLGHPLGLRRDDMLQELIDGRPKYQNVFCYPTPTWADGALMAWLVDGAALETQGGLLGTSYAPYARILRRFGAEQGLHLRQGAEAVQALATGSRSQRAMLQEALGRWWLPLMHFFGPPGESPNQAAFRWRIRILPNEALRQNFLGKYVPQIQRLGLRIPDEQLGFDPATGRWVYGDLRWEEFWRVVRGRGGSAADRLHERRLSRQEQSWVREALGRPESAA